MSTSGRNAAAAAQSCLRTHATAKLDMATNGTNIRNVWQNVIYFVSNLYDLYCIFFHIAKAEIR